jgi:hypothetical protein
MQRLAASGMMDAFKKMWPDAWGVRMEHILPNVLMALLERCAHRGRRRHERMGVDEQNAEALEIVMPGGAQC